jgi:hypothetical protein
MSERRLSSSHLENIKRLIEQYKTLFRFIFGFIFGMILLIISTIFCPICLLPMLISLLLFVSGFLLNEISLVTLGFILCFSIPFIYKLYLRFFRKQKVSHRFSSLTLTQLLFGAFFFLVGYMKTYMLLVFWGFLEIFAIVGVHRLKIRKKPRLARAVVFFLTAIGVSAVLLDSLNISF